MEDNGLYLAEVLRYNVVGNSWSRTGNMTEPRRSSTVAVISNDANDGQFCPAEPYSPTEPHGALWNLRYK